MLITLLFLTACFKIPAFAATKKTTKESVEIISDVNNGTVYISGEFLDGDILKISVLSKEFSVPTLGIAFHLEYEGEKISFLKYEPGDFLELGGDPFYLVKNDNEKFEILFGETLRKNDTFPLDGGQIVDFYFQINNGEIFDFKFHNGVVSTLDTVRQDVDRVIFENIVIDKNDQNFVLSEGNFDNPTNQSFLYKYLNNSFVSTFVLLILATFSSVILIKLIKKYVKNKPSFSHLPIK